MSRSNSRRKPLEARTARCPASAKHQIEIIVETLSGTAFEMTASPSETLLSIKSKIQHVEGIPVAHQHLIHNLKELQNDTATLSECGLKNGSKLRLVLSLRGGPISTKRIPVLSCGDDFEQEFEPVPSGSQVVLLTQDGEYLSLLKVVKNEDGTFSPLKEDWPSPELLMDNDGCDIPDDDPCLPLIMPVPSAESREQQNAITKSKMDDLRLKIEQLSLKKKLKKLQAESSAAAIPDLSFPSSSGLNRRPLLPPIAPMQGSQPSSSAPPPASGADQMSNASLVRQIHLNHFVLDNRPRTSPETLYVVGHNLNQAVQKEAKEMCRLLGEVRRRQWTKESAGPHRFREQLPLPPPPPAPVKKRCQVCRRRLNITNSHTCRCSGLFCAAHRYAETHDCTFDYKLEGRKYISQNNPLVVMPKLPKI